MKQFKYKNIIILLLSILTIASCRTKKTFNGTTSLDCPDHNPTKSENKDGLNKKTKWKLVLYKDGERVAGSKKRGKSRLFKNKK